ncbi:GtrA family protein [Alicyclobacillaceae bacterium I2511]|nr:GtrA family protein [Alicyclobacillaceae bacterium I2511]
MAAMRKLRGQMNRFIKFAAVGGTGIGVNLIILVSLRGVGVPPLESSWMASMVAVVSNWVLNSWITWGGVSRGLSKAKRLTQALVYFGVSLVGSFTTAAVFLACVWHGWPYLDAQVIGIIVTSLWTYGVHSGITWGRGHFGLLGGIEA